MRTIKFYCTHCGFLQSFFTNKTNTWGCECKECGKISRVLALDKDSK